MADFREQLRDPGVQRQLRDLEIDPDRKHPLDFLPPTAFAWGKNGTKSSIAFTGMAGPADFEFDCGPEPLEPFALQGKSIAVDCGAGEGHFQSVELLGKDSILSQERHRKEFPIPIQKYPYLHRLVVAAAAASNSSKAVESDWGRASNYFNTRSNLRFATLSLQYTLPNATAMQLDFASIEKDDLRFRVALEIGRLPGWRKFYEEDKTLRDAMHADYRYSQAAKNGHEWWARTNHGGSYRGEKHLNPTEQDKKTVLSKTLGVCKLIGIESDASKVAGFRLQLGLPPPQPRGRAQRPRQPMAEDQQSPRPQSPPQPPSPPSPPSSPEPPPPLPPTPPLPPQSPTLPPPSKLPPSSPADQGDGGVEATEDGGDGGGGVSSITEGEGGVGGDAGGVGADEDGDGEGEEEDDHDDDAWAGYEFRDVEVDENTRSIEFLYNVFQACTPKNLLNSDNIWQPSKVGFKDYQGVISARVTRRPAPLLRCFLGRLDTVLNAKLTFDVYLHCNFLRYILRQSWSGLVVVKIEALREPADGDDWSKTAQIRRIMCTKHALEQCEDEPDVGPHLGKESLEKFKKSLEYYQRDQKPWTVGKEVYHESDVVEDVDVRELIGVVRWYPFRSSEAPNSTYFKTPHDYPAADLIYIGDSFRQTIRTAKSKRIGKQSEGRGPSRR
jgi:hypothetical protein